MEPVVFKGFINLEMYKYNMYIYRPASLGTSPPHPMVMGLYSSAPVPPLPVVWVVVVVVEEVVYVCI